MSSGSVGNKSACEGQQFVGSGDFRIWSGGDGKYETTPAGKVRSKWNNYTLDRGFRRRSSNVWTCTKVSNGQTFTVLADVKGTYSKVASAALDLKAQSRLTEKVRGHSFNLAVNASQSGQMVNMVVDNLGKLGRSVLALKRGDFHTAARQLGARPRPSRLAPSDVSGRWLELQYGWLPALMDVSEAAKAYEKITKKERTSIVRASAKETSLVENHVSGVWGTSKGSVTQRVVYTYEMTEQLTVARSMGLYDPLSVLWENIPYSFVVDWFIPIGTYLDNLSIIPRLTGRRMVNRSWEMTGNQPLTYVGTLPGFFGGFNCSKVQYLGTDTLRSFRSERTIATGPWTAARPSFNASGLHGTRVWNAIALAAQRFLS